MPISTTDFQNKEYIVNMTYTEASNEELALKAGDRIKLVLTSATDPDIDYDVSGIYR